MTKLDRFVHSAVASRWTAYRRWMGNRPRQVEPDGVYHFGSRGSNRQRIYLDGIDHDIWTRLFARVVRRRGWEVLAFVQMPNHFHGIARVPADSFSSGMQELNYGYSRRTNARHGRCAHLFENRFWSKLIESNDQLLTEIAYLDVNPYKSSLRIHPRDWLWGSYAAIAGYVLPPSFLAAGEVLGLFSPDPATAVRRYRGFVADAMARVDRARSQATATKL